MSFRVDLLRFHLCFDSGQDGAHWKTKKKKKKSNQTARKALGRLRFASYLIPLTQVIHFGSVSPDGSCRVNNGISKPGNKEEEQEESEQEEEEEEEGEVTVKTTCQLVKSTPGNLLAGNSATNHNRLKRSGKHSSIIHSSSIKFIAIMMSSRG